MKARNVLDREACETKYRFGQLESVKNKSYYNGVVLRELFTNYNLNFTENDIVNIALANIPNESFHTNRESEINLDLLKRKLIRFQTYMKTHLAPSSSISNGSTVKIIHNITVDYSFIVNKWK